MPKTGGAIICANHIHLFDPVVIALAVERPVRFMGKTELFSWPIVGYLARKAGVFPVKRGSADMQAIRQSLRILQEGELLGIFPEGTRSKDGEIAPFYSSVTMLAERGGVPVIPAAISGEYRFGRTVKVLIGETTELTALSPEPYERGKATAGLMARIKSLKDSLR
ncbi:MAG: 1-acyl-sn-glycerol-3-phosphate acyltransferase [Firmicutes bacterium]|nr:1-acyl-sn-glycerol-3-phosphate acyltransferase [Bacillota bacterium]